MKRFLFSLVIILSVFCRVQAAEEAAAPSAFPGLKDATVLLIRHAEKLEEGRGLAPAGEARARAYVEYFKQFKVAGQPLKLDYLVATADSEESQRPRATLEPLSQALGLPLDTRYKNKRFAELAHDLEFQSRGKAILICWHHGSMPELLRALGANPEKLLPKGKWPEDQFAWVIQLRYDSEGRLIPEAATRINENLMPGDNVDKKNKDSK